MNKKTIKRCLFYIDELKDINLSLKKQRLITDFFEIIFNQEKLKNDLKGKAISLTINSKKKENE